MADSQVFVSFSATDDPVAKAYVRQLLSRLAAQPALQVWIYESPQGRIGSGESIAETCRRYIDDCDMFILVLTDQALESDYVGMEVSHVLWVREQRISKALRIYPLLAASMPRHHWLPQFSAAIGFRGRTIDISQPQVEPVVLDACLALGIDYAAAPDTDRRLPLRGRLILELQSARPRSEFDTANFQILLQKCDLAVRSLAAGEASGARMMTESILIDIGLYYDGYRSYYVNIVRASAVLAEAHQGRASFEAAYQAFNEIVAEGSSLLDANAYAGRAHALLQLGRYLDALDDYARAERFLERLDPALLYNSFRASILAGVQIDPVQVQTLESLLQQGLVTQQIGDHSRVAAIVCLAHAYAGDIGGVQRAWSYASEPAATDAAVVCEACHWLEQRCLGWSRPDALRLCEQLLLRRLSATRDPTQADALSLTQQLARIEFQSGRCVAALARVAASIDQCPRHVVLALDAALFAIEAGERGRAAHYCSLAIGVRDHTQCAPPLDRVSYEHAIAQAHWLLGQSAESQACYRRSGLPETQWFAQTMPQLFGAASGLTAVGQSIH